MECITHFSHEHPLCFFQLHDFDDPKPYKCSICGLPILHSPSYTCSNIDANCNFFVHKPCTQLPRELYHDGHSDTLILERRTSSNQGFAYKCKNYSKCKFDLHPLSTKAVEIKSNHISHNSHPLVVFCREMLCRCDACGEKQKGFFFCCQECDVWVHQDCTILPTIVKLRDQPHPYILNYSTHILRRTGICLICGRHCYSGVYFCCETYRVAHVSCAKAMMEDRQTNAIEELIQLPQEEDAYPSMVIRRFAERYSSSSTQLVHHKHPLIFVDVDSREAASACVEDLVCDVCVQPLHLSSSYYKCQSDGCHFLAHPICANQLPACIQLPLVLFVHPMQDSDVYKNIFFSSVFPCLLCHRPSNGTMYCFLDKEESLLGFCDIECVLSPKIIKHASHRQHLLFQILTYNKSLIPVVSCCSGESFIFDTYKCAACDFSIHIGCALLPNKTRHKFDEHTLQLIMSHDHHEDNKQEVFCEVCEQEIEFKLWHYGCDECEQYFHVNCIPSVGLLSKVKFGKRLIDGNIHPNHPLTLIRMLAHGRHERCGLCHKIIRGYSDDQMAFHCSDCDFWIHFSCASATTALSAYSKFQEETEEGHRQILTNLPDY